MKAPGGNWAGNLKYSADSIVIPESATEVREVVLANPKNKALGSRHSFSAIANTDGVLISTEYLNRILSLDPERRTVTVEPGVRYGDLARFLHSHGFAVANLASLPHISVAGACATATHGSGLGNGALSTAVASMHFVDGNGHLIRLARGEEGFGGAVVHLGALGIVTELTLDVVPTFEVAQTVHTDLPLSDLETRLEEIMSVAYSVSLFTDWRGPTINQVWVKRRVGDEIRELHGAAASAGALHPIGSMPPDYCTEQGGVAGAWHDRLPHFRMEFTPSCGEELQSEFIVPLSSGFEAIRAIMRLRDRIAPHLLISEIRAVAADDHWLSPFFGRDSLAIHFTWCKEWDAVLELLPAIEEALAPFEARPHWGKLFSIEGETLRNRYPRWDDFVALAERFDPNRKFRNSFLDALLNPSGSSRH